MKAKRPDVRCRQRFVALVCCLVTIAVWYPTQAQIQTDGTMGAGQALAGPDFDIPESLGTRAGDNLFHSFEHFNINSGESATFSGSNSIRNLFSRVTGGSASNIDGLLRSTIPEADFFFINPSGVMFGPNATLDVQGSFHVSTADRISFPDGASFAATDPSSTILSVAEPSAFGFLDSKPGSITVDRSDLTVPDRKTLSFVGGDITIEGEGGDVADVAFVPGTTFDDLRNFLIAPSGAVEMTSVASAGEVSLSGYLDLDDFERLGSIQTDDLIIDVSGNATAGTPGGAVRIEGGEILVNNTHIDSVGFGPQDGGDITFRGRDVTVSADRQRLENSPATRGQAFSVTTPTTFIANSNDLGRGGDISLEAHNLTIQGGVGIFANNFGPGPSGDITLRADEYTQRFSSSIGTSSFGSGLGGDVTLDAEKVFIVGDDAVRFTGLFTDSLADGPGGDLFVNAKTIELLNAGHIDSFSGGGSGPGGDVVVEAESILVEEPARSLEDIPERQFSSIEALTSSEGPAGDTLVIADRVVVKGLLANIGGLTFRGGDAGTTTIRAEKVEVLEGGGITVLTVASEGAAGGIVIEADELTISNESADLASGIAVATVPVSLFGAVVDAPGNGGNIVLSIGTLKVLTGGLITSGTGGTGDGGDISITADHLEIAGDGTSFLIEEFPNVSPNVPNFTGILSSASTPDSGSAGDIAIKAGSLVMRSGGIIASTTEGVGSGGSITLDLDQLSIRSGARLDASTVSAAPAGGITVNAEQILVDGPSSGLFNQSFSAALGAGIAGDINITGRELRLTNGAQISTQSALADGGNVTLTLADLLLLRDSSITTSVGTGFGAGGNITIDPAVVVVDGSTIQANAFGGPGGNIQIVADFFIASDDSLIQASSQLGVDGVIEVDSPDTDVTSRVVVLADTLLDATARLEEACEARGGRTLASFVGAGRGALPLQPGAAMPSLYLLDANAKVQGATEIRPDVATGSYALPGTLTLACSP